MGRENEKSNITQMFRENKGHSLKTLLLLFRGRYLALFGSVFFFVIKHSPTWVLPIVTANIINAVTDKEGDIVRILTVNTILMLVFLVQNVATNYIHTWLYAKSVRGVEKELREALIVKLQQLSITYHKEMQSGRLQSKIMRDVEQVQTLASQIFISLITIILNIVVSFGVVIYKSKIVFLFFVCTIPVAVLIIVGFKGKIKSHNREFREEMEETSAKVMEMVEMIPVTNRKNGTAVDKNCSKRVKAGHGPDLFFIDQLGGISDFSGVLSGVYCLHGVERVDSNRRYYAVSDLFFIYCCTDCKCDGIASDYFQRVGIS